MELYLATAIITSNIAEKKAKSIEFLEFHDDDVRQFM
jgi:hypothetical protein